MHAPLQASSSTRRKMVATQRLATLPHVHAQSSPRSHVSTASTCPYATCRTRCKPLLLLLTCTVLTAKRPQPLKLNTASGTRASTYTPYEHNRRQCPIKALHRYIKVRPPQTTKTTN